VPKKQVGTDKHDLKGRKGFVKKKKKKKRHVDSSASNVIQSKRLDIARHTHVKSGYLPAAKHVFLVQPGSDPETVLGGHILPLFFVERIQRLGAALKTSGETFNNGHTYCLEKKELRVFTVRFALPR